MCVCACTRRYEYVHVRCMCCMCTSVRSKAMGVAAQSVIEVLRARLSVPTETETETQTGLLRAESTSAPCSFPHFYPFQRKSLPTVYSLPPFRRFFVPISAASSSRDYNLRWPIGFGSHHTRFPSLPNRSAMLPLILYARSAKPSFRKQE